jgi:hypothetical protein
MRGFSVMIPSHPVYVKDFFVHDDKQPTVACSYGVKDSLPVVDNLRQFTLDKLLSEANIIVFSRMSFNPKNKEQYVKNATAILPSKLNDWITEYLKTHSPCPY